MLTMCWFYCVPFFKGLFFAFSPLLLVFSLFVFKRALRKNRPSLRQLAFFLAFLALAKAATLDLYLLRHHVPASPAVVQVAGLAILAVTGLGLRRLYAASLQPELPRPSRPGSLAFWAYLSAFLVFTLIVWVIAPWAGFLTVGRVPRFFVEAPRQYLAVGATISLLIGFWRAEDFTFTGAKTWTPRDTLWLSAVLFLVAFAFSYASHDVLSGLV